MSKEKIISKHKVAGAVLACAVCKNDEFWTRRTLMNTPGMTLFGIEWANKSALNYVCSQCGHVMWFLNQN